MSAREFIRRFSWYILPAGLVRIRHYGILGHNRRGRNLPRARALLAQRGRRRRPLPALPPLPLRRCPHCGEEGVKWIGFITAPGHTHLRVPVVPAWW